MEQESIIAVHEARSNSACIRKLLSPKYNGEVADVETPIITSVYG